jgi:hypothetical protein
MLKLEVLKENNDGSANVVFDYDEEFIEYYKRESKAERIDDKEVGKFITAMLYKACGEEMPTTPKV